MTAHADKGERLDSWKEISAYLGRNVRTCQNWEHALADGMTEALIDRLSDIAALKTVTARSSVFAYKNSEKSSARIAKKLGVDALVETTLTRSGSRVGIRARLIRARGGQPLGPPISLEREMAEVLALQSELVAEIANEIRIQLTARESERLKTSRPVDPKVYELALEGKVTLEHATRELEFRRAIELFEKAVDRDPSFAPAWAGLGEALWYIGSSGFEYVDPEAVRGRAIAAADKALELDPGLPEAHQARGSVAYDGEWDIEKAARHFKRALELRPGFSSAHAYYSLILMTWLGRFEEAGRHIDRAKELDPLMPWNDMGTIAWWQWQGRPDKALEEGDRARRRNPANGGIRWRMGSLLLLLGQPGLAISEFEAADELSGPGRLVPNLAALGLANGLAGRSAEALRILAEMERLSRERYVSPFALAIVNSGLGRMDEAFRLLERALEERHPALVFCRPHRGEIVALRRDARWKPFIDRLRWLVKLPPGTPDPYS